MKIIGLTGGIGSGKSTIARAFEKIGVPVYIADDASKRILNNHTQAIIQVKELLGSESYIKEIDGGLRADKKYIASKVFKDPLLLDQLNQILHPLVKEDFDHWLDKQQALYIIYEAAILFESGGDSKCDEVIVVWTNEAERISRVMKRDGSTESEVKERLKNQWNDDQRLQKANYVIINEDLQSIDQYVININEIMLK